ncbi:MAG: hypothetical protein V4548_12315 [Bacteroidota bacterium]
MKTTTTILILLFYTQMFFAQKAKNFKYDIQLKDYPSSYELNIFNDAKVEKTIVEFEFFDLYNEIAPDIYFEITDDNLEKKMFYSDFYGKTSVLLKPGNYIIEIKSIFTKLEIPKITLEDHTINKIKVVLGYNYSLDGFGTIYCKAKLTKQEIEEIILKWSSGNKSTEINGKKFTISWQI